MTKNKSPTAYSSIYLDPGWAHQKYFGWATVVDAKGVRILAKKKWLLTRYLILLSRSGLPTFADAIGFTNQKSDLSEFILHDFDRCFEAPPTVGTWHFRPATLNEYILNGATMVIDISRDETSILAGMSSDYRRKIRRAMALGINVEVHCRPGEDLQRLFLSAYSRLAYQRRFQPAKANVVRAMYDAGDAVLFVIRKKTEISNLLHVYMTSDKAIFMYGVNNSKENDGAGQFLQWSAMKYLKSVGIRWYDLGGVSSLDPTNGIYNFKLRLGSRPVDLGQEWIRAGLMVRAAKRVYSFARQFQYLQARTPVTEELRN